ncbi:MAG: hypothetical protein AB7V77_00935 [Candidatus Woesearchaeota archaeon]
MENYDDIYWGYIFMNKDGEIKHIIKKESTPLINHLKALKELAYTTLILNSKPRKKMKQTGFISYHPIFNALEIWGMKTCEKTTLKDVMTLNSEIEAIALNSGKQYLAAITTINKKIMTRFGWKKAEGEHSVYTYTKKLF